jgi:O-methyltransferase
MDKTNIDTQKIIKNYPLISEQMTPKRLQIILHYLALILEREQPGDVVEFGCFSGTTSLFIRRLLNLEVAINRQLHVYDSFEGLPAKTIKDASVAGSGFKAGELKSPKRQLIKNFKQASLKPPIIHKGWFSDLTDKDVPNLIAFAFLDGDFYTSIMESLNLIWPKITKDSIIIIDDYQRSNLPGVSRAIEDFFKQINQFPTIQQQQNLAIITNNYIAPS